MRPRINGPSEVRFCRNFVSLKKKILIKRSRLYTFLFCLIAALAELLDNAVDEVLTHQLSVALLGCIAAHFGL